MADPRLRVFVPEPMPDYAFERLRGMAEIAQGPVGRVCRPDELIDQAARSDALIVTSRDQITADIIRAAPRLKIIAKAGAKPNNVDIGAAAAQGTLVTWTPGANSVAVAEYAVGLALILAKHIFAYNRHVLNGGWRNYDLLGSELCDKTAGLIGFGAIGQQVARRLRAFGMKIETFDPGISSDLIAREGALPRDASAVIGAADFLFLHCELNDRTRNIIDEKALRSMKRSAMLINTARGGLIDEAALLEALTQGWIAGAALDVYAQEPVDPANPLLRLPNVVATPHMAAFSREAIMRETQWAAEDVALVLSGGQPVHWRPA
jgi:D-3-phosphoglycerate dehydrogenase